MRPFLTHLSPSLQQLLDMPEQKMEIPILLNYKTFQEIQGYISQSCITPTNVRCWINAHYTLCSLLLLDEQKAGQPQ